VSAGIFTIDSREKLSWTALAELWGYRELLFALSVRSVRTRYRQSLLGIGWAIAQPVLMMVVFNLVFSRITKVPSDGLPYPIFSYSALVPWTYFSNGVILGTSALVANRALVTKMWFPRELIVMSEVGARFFDFLAGALVFIGLMVWYQVNPTWWLLLLVPLLLVETILIVAVTLITSAMYARFRDVAPIVTLGVQIWLYVTPVVYPLSSVPAQWQTLYMLNPMVGLIEAFRAVIAFGREPDMLSLGIASLMSVLLIAVAYPWFKVRERSFADVI
jgi:lipopolysaccharide transport system permease protein